MIQSEWIRIICMAVQLFHTAEGGSETNVRVHWNTPDTYGYIAPDSLKAVSLALVTGTEAKVIKEFIMIPWQDLYERKLSSDDINLPLSLKFLTVTPYAMIFEKLADTHDSNFVKKTLNFERAFFRIIGFDSSQRLIRDEHGFAIPNRLQVIRLREYPYYIDLETALPGSKAVQPAIPENMPRGKMICLSLIPDYGTVHRQWLFQPFQYEDSCIERSEKSALFLIAKMFEQSLNKSREFNRLSLYDQCRFQVGSDIAVAGCENNNANRKWNRIIRQLLMIDEEEDAYTDIRKVYPDYMPKRTPDTMSDFMPEIMDDIESMPVPELKNLNELLKIFFGYEKRAQKNRGKWINGRMMLGADEKEYCPSKEELLLNECGIRIRTIVESANSSELERYIKENRIKTEKIKFMHFTFRHSDVMGSGRFFYVQDMLTIKVRIIKKK